MADDPSYFVITTVPGGKTTEYVSAHPLDAALYILRADQQGLAHRVFAVDDDRARETSLAELAATEPSPGLVADMWHNARVAWLRHHLRIPADPDAPWEPDWEGAAARWAAAFRAPLPDGIEEAVALTRPVGRGWELVHERVSQLLELLEHESQWRDQARASYPEWSSRDYQQAWRQLRAHADNAPALDTTADFFLTMALERDLRAAAIEGFLGFGHPGLEQWARAAYRYDDENELIRRDGENDDYWASREEAARLYSDFTAGPVSLTEEERAWAARWPRERDPGPVRDWAPDGEDAQREFWQHSRVQQAAAEEQQTTQDAAFAFLAAHHEEIIARAPTGTGEGVVAQARRLLRAAFPSEQQARLEAARQLSVLDEVLDVPGALDQGYLLSLQEREEVARWMALGRVEEALRALTWNQPVPSDEPTVPALAPPLLRIGPEGGPYRVTADPRQALSAWTQQDRPGPDTLFPANPVRIEESEAGGRWRQRTARSLVEQVRASISEPYEHWEVDRELAQWLLADEPEGLHPEEMGARWIRYLSEVPPRGPVLAWVSGLADFAEEAEEANMLARIQRGAAEEQAALDWGGDFFGRRRAVYHPEAELAEAIMLAGTDDADIEDAYLGPAADDLGARPEPAPRATILASATVGNTHYAHAEFTQPPRQVVVAYSADGFPAPYLLADSQPTDTSVLFERLTSAEGRALAAAEGTSAAQRAALEAAGQAWSAARRAEERSDLQLELYELAKRVQSGELDTDGYAQQAGPLWDALFPVLEGRAPLEAGDLRRWYAVRVADDDTAWSTLTADPLEAVAQWAQHDRPMQRYVILTGTAGSTKSTELPVGRVLAQALGEVEAGQETRLGQALADWLQEAHRGAAAHSGPGHDPMAWRQAGAAWALRIDHKLPSLVTDHLDIESWEAAEKGTVETTAALRAARAANAGSHATSEHQMRRHWAVLAGASVHTEEARPYARAALDRLISLDPAAPKPAPGNQVGQHSAWLWYLSRELERGNLMDVFSQVAAPAPEPPELSSTLGALPKRLLEQPDAARQLLRAAERAVGHQVLEPLYGDYPTGIREERAAATREASQAFFLQSVAEAARGQAASRAHDLRARPGAGTDAALSPAARPQQALDAAQQHTAILPPSSSQSPTVR
ncbi:hypothetical protein [Streptomyces sp. NPDC001165]|uniref:hypothetical protein n=1 Tax=Streptomyces sp. NPDC001165 TaxID=3364546 RepID=UPI003680CDC2